MRQREAGSTLLTVMAAVLILTTMMTALLATSARDMTDSGQYIGATSALANARSGMRAVYQETISQWKSIGGASTTDVTVASNDLNVLSQKVLNLSSWIEAPFKIDKFQLGENNIQQMMAKPLSGSNLYANYDVEVSSTVNGVTRTLTDTFTISGPVGGPVYAQNNLYVLGNPTVDSGTLTAHSTYFDSTSWNFLSLLSSLLNWDSSNPLPNLTGSAIQSANYYSFNGFGQLFQLWFSRANDAHDNLTQDIDDLPTSIASGSLTNYETGGKVVPYTTMKSPLAANVDTTIATARSSMQNLPQVSMFSGSLPASGGYVNPSGAYTDKTNSWVDGWAESHKMLSSSEGRYFDKDDSDDYPGSFWVTGDSTINGQTYINGNLYDPNHTINFSTPLYVNGNVILNAGTLSGTTTTAPLYVKGNLYILGGTLNSKSPIYVQGNVVMLDVPSGPNQMEIYSDGDITLGALPTLSPTQSVIDGFLVSNENVYLDGSNEMYHIQGQVAGQNVVLNSRDFSVGSLLNLKTGSPGLWITNSPYLSTGMSLEWQAMPQPTITVGS